MELARLVNENLGHLRPWMPWAQESMTETRQDEFITAVDRGWAGLTEFVYGVFVQGRMVGSAGLHERGRRDGTLEIGYWISAAETGRGYATAASHELTKAAFQLLDVDAVEIRCDEANVASAAIPARLGYRLRETCAREPGAPGESGKEQVWEMTRAGWNP